MLVSKELLPKCQRKDSIEREDTGCHYWTYPNQSCDQGARQQRAAKNSYMVISGVKSRAREGGDYYAIKLSLL